MNNNQPNNSQINANMSMLAPYASFASLSKGRLVDEEPATGRSPFQRDRDRILHSSGFRRLKGKTQVFVAREDEDYRTRLTHTLEVAQISRSIARELKVDEDLTEALALAHDLGHSPFGHAGEEALDKCLKEYGLSFDHNAQSLKVVTSLEHNYADFDGLNLTWETLEGLAKHNGPLTGKDIPAYIKDFNDKFDLHLDSFAGIEAQIAAICDDIAYNSHDIFDGLYANLFTKEQLCEVPFMKDIFAAITNRYSQPLGFRQMIHEASRKIINQFVTDTVAETRKNLAMLAPNSADDIRHANKIVVAFSPAMQKNMKELHDFLFANMYRHYKIRRATSKGRRIIKELFQLYMREPDLFKSEELCASLPEDLSSRAILVTDYISSLTDAAAAAEYRSLFQV